MNVPGQRTNPKLKPVKQSPVIKSLQKSKETRSQLLATMRSIPSPTQQRQQFMAFQSQLRCQYESQIDQDLDAALEIEDEIKKEKSNDI